MNEIHYPLPDDIDLTEDDVFHKRNSFSLSTTPKNKLPWETALDDYTMYNSFNINITNTENVTINIDSLDPIGIIGEWTLDDGSRIYDSIISNKDIHFTSSTTSNSLSTSSSRSYFIKDLSNLLIRRTEVKNRFKRQSIDLMLELYNGMPFSPVIGEYDLSVHVDDFSLLKEKESVVKGFNMSELKYIDIKERSTDIRRSNGYPRYYWNSWYNHSKDNYDDGGIDFLKVDFSIDEFLATEKRRIRGATILLLPWETTDRNFQEGVQDQNWDSMVAIV